MTFEEWFERYSDKNNYHSKEELKILAKQAWEAAQPKWQPIETVPLDSDIPHYFLVHTSHENILMACGMEGEITYLTFMDGLSFDTNCYGKPTHWMPLPPPPNNTKLTDEVKND